MGNIDNFDIRTHIIESVVEIFGTMLSTELEATSTIPPESLEDLCNVVSVRFSGDATGMLSIYVGDHFTRRLAAEMFGMQVEELEGDEAIRDMMGELGNMVGGDLKSAFIDAGLSCAHSTPSITAGYEFKIESLNLEEYERLTFRCDHNVVFVEMGVKISDPVQRAGQQEEDIYDEVGRDETNEKYQAAPPSPPPDEEPQRPEDFDLDLLLDIPLELKIELGRARIQIQELLNLRPGSAVKLVRLEGEPVDILANDTLIAKGEVVVQNEKYGIRVTEITSRMDRIRSCSI